MNYSSAISFLDRCINYERIGFEFMTRERHLEEFAAFLDQLGGPHRTLPFVHIAGTKGKGSTALLLAAALERNGYKTGLFTSPHIEDYTERIKTGLRDIPQDDFGRLLDDVVAQYPPEKQQDHAGFRTVFELLTAMALVYFREMKADIVILETGLGGRLDATNVVLPLISVITTLGMEHTETLGDTIEQIAAEKAGIIKAKCPVVVSRQQPRWHNRVMPVIEKAAHRQRAPLHLAESVMPLRHRTPGGRPGAPQHLLYVCVGEGGREFPVDLSLPGEHQAANLQTGLATLCLLRQIGWRLDDERIREGVEVARLPGRIEVLNAEPPLVLDCAHCPSSFRALLSTLDEVFPHAKIILLMGLARHKRRDDIFELLAAYPRVMKVMFYPLPTPRSDSPQDLAALARTCGLNAVAYESIPACLDAARALQAQMPGSVIVGAGSFYGMAPLRHALEDELENRKGAG